MIKCILFDRDGTLGYLDDVRLPWTFHEYKDIKKVFKDIKEKGYKVGIITNQSCISRGTSNNYDFDKEFKGYDLDIYKICPHDDKDNCDCRKPKNGLLKSVCEELNIDPKECIVIGDRLSDVMCALSLSSIPYIVKNENNLKDLNIIQEKHPDIIILDDFSQILNYI